MAINTVPESVNPDRELDRVREQLSLFGLSIIDLRDGAYRVYWPHRSYGERDFDTLDEVEAWIRGTLPSLKLSEARDVLSGIGEIVRLLDPDNADCDCPTAVVIAVTRLVEHTQEALSHYETLDFINRKPKPLGEPDDESVDDEPADTPEQTAYRRGHRDGLWHAENAISEAVKTLHGDETNRQPPDLTEPAHEV